MWFANLCSHSISCHFTLITSFAWRFLVLMEPSLYTLFFCFSCFWYNVWEPITKSKAMKIHPFLFLSVFYGFNYYIRVLIHFELIFIQYEVGVKLHLLPFGNPVFLAPFVKLTIISPWMNVVPLLQINWL